MTKHHQWRTVVFERFQMLRNDAHGDQPRPVYPADLVLLGLANVYEAQQLSPGQALGNFGRCNFHGKRHYSISHLLTRIAGAEAHSRKSGPAAESTPAAKNPGTTKPKSIGVASNALVILHRQIIGFQPFSLKMKHFRLPLMAALAAVCAFGQTRPVFSTGQAARLVIGQTNFTFANYGASNTLLGSPSGIALANGVLWVVDSNRLGATPDNNRVLRFSDTSSYPSPTDPPDIPGNECGVCRGKASLVLGQPDFITSNYALSPTGMRNPTGVATDGNILVISDTDNNRILIWHSQPTVNGQPPDTVIGQKDLVSGGTSVPPTASSLRGPTGVWLAGGKHYVADTQDNRILIFNKVPAAGTNNAAADVVVGQPDFTSFVQPDLTKAVNATTTASNMQAPVSVTTDGKRMFVTDLGQNRVLIYNTIPTANGVAADVVVGQPGMTSAYDNNSYTTADANVDSVGNSTSASAVLCQSNGTDTAGTATYPARCAATLSLPRYALSDGTRLFIADGGNDRILIFNTIPTTNGARADVILGEPDEFSDNTGQNPDGSDAFQTPVAMVWDAAAGNLYVSDTYNRRIVVYTPGVPNIPLAAIRNAASLEIYAIGSVQLAGTITAKDTFTITINSRNYTYTVVATDTLQTLTDNITKIINAAPDPDAVASRDDATYTVIITARIGGASGGNITLAATTSANATVTASASGANLNIYLQNPTSIAPGTVIQITGQNLCDTPAAGDLSRTLLATTLASCQVYIDGVRVPLLYVSPNQINAQMPVEFTDRTSVSLYVRAIHADGSVTATSPIAATIVPQNPGIFAQPGSDPRPGLVFHGSSNAVSMISVDGGINAGDTATITIGTTVYTYKVLATDTLDSVRNAFVNLINAGPDPYVYASVSNEYDRIILTALTPGPAGEGTAVVAAVTGTNAALSLTVFSPTLCCDNIQGALVTTDNPAIPGEFLYVLATGLGPTNPADTPTGQVYRGGELNPPAVNVDSILTGGKTANVVNVSLAPGLVGVYFVEFELDPGVTADVATQMTIAQQTFVSNVVTFPVVIPAVAASAARTPVNPDPVSPAAKAPATKSASSAAAPAKQSARRKMSLLH